MRALVLVGASGVGKSTAAEALMSAHPEFSLVRSATTRLPRGDGRDLEYVYLSKDEFASRIKSGEMLEYTEFGGNFYGTPKSELERIWDEGGVPLMVLDLNGARSFSDPKLGLNAVIVYIYENLSVIESRLIRRCEKNSLTDASLVLRRMELNRADYLSLREIYPVFFGFVRNDELSRAADEIYKLYLTAIDGKDADTEENRKIAESLALSADG